LSITSSKKSIFSWCLYDWANSVVSTIIFTFIFSVYFSRGIVGDEVLGSAYWGYAVGFAGFVIAILAPILGAFSDCYGARKPLLAFLTIATITATAMLFFAMPSPDYIAYALTFVIITIVCFELGQAQYNAMLSGITKNDKIGRVSGWAWGMGYFGGLTCLVIALLGFIGLGDQSGFLNIPSTNSMDIRSTTILAALWYAIFALPLFIFVSDRAKKQLKGNVIKQSIVQLRQTVKSLFSTSANIGRFLIASAIYRDGLNTLFVIGGLYAAGTFGMSFEEILIFAIGLNIASGFGAFALAYLDDFIGAKRTIIISILSLIILTSAIMVIEDKDLFLILAITLGLFIGPAQSSSRSLLAKLAPPEQTSEIFGLYAMTGKSISFVGPTLFALITQITDSQRWGISAIILLWVIGLILLVKVKEE
jgi:UMF1 family MFS transporter